MVSMTDTKKVIYEAYMEEKKKLDELKAMQPDPYASQKAEAKAKVEADAAELLATPSFINPALVEKFNSLDTAIADKEKTLADLTGVEQIVVDMQAMISAKNVLKAQLDAKAKEEADTRKVEKEAQEQEKRDAITALENEYKEKKVSLLKEYEDSRKALKLQREREEEEYVYNLKRSRQKENDEWADEKAEREKILAERESTIALRETKLGDAEDIISELEEQVDAIEDIKKQAFADGKVAGKAEADKSNAFEKRAIENKLNSEIEALKKEIALLEKANEDLSKTNATLNEKLDSSYTKVENMALEVAKAIAKSGQTTVVTEGK